MDDDVWERQALALIKAFRGITDPRKRQRILDLAEQLADGVPCGAAEPGGHDASTVREHGDSPGCE